MHQIIDGYRRILGWIDSHRHRRGSRVATICHGVVNCCRTEEISFWRVAQCTITIHDDRTVTRLSTDYRQRIAIRVGIIAQYINHDRVIFIDSSCIVDGRRRIILGVHRQGDRCR